jgi:DtxR family transcriptional regulator, Mn-dependent transcriptional regulator
MCFLVGAVRFGGCLESERPSKTIEDYLLTIYTLSSEGRSVIAARLADALEVAPPTVTATLQRMARDGLVEVNHRKEVVLTPGGHEHAERMVRRHRLAERLLVDILGVDWADVHEEAHRFEHAISPRVEERILAVLGAPTTCPHGSPIPGTGASSSSEAVRLELVAVGDHVTVERISEEAEDDHDLLSYFQRSGLLPGHTFDVLEVEPYNSLLVLRGEDDQIPISLSVAHNIWVRK